MQFRAYRLCQNPTGAESCWINSTDDTGTERGDAYDVWKSAAKPSQFKPGAPTFIGVDAAKSRDHAAVVWGQFSDDGRLHVKARIWTPTKTQDIDLEEIADHLRALCRDYDVQAIWFDPSYFYNAPALDNEGLPMIQVPPSEMRMAPLVGHAYQSIRRGRITHDDDPQFTAEVLAGRRKYGPHGFCIEKRHHARKIDSAVALVLCHGAAQGYEPADPEARFAFYVPSKRAA
jgi:phage terminase large subunit-like protein